MAHIKGKSGAKPEKGLKKMIQMISFFQIDIIFVNTNTFGCLRTIWIR